MIWYIILVLHEGTCWEGGG